MKNNEKTMRGLGIAVVVLLLLSIAGNIYWLSRPELVPTVKTDTIWRDTMVRVPVPAETIRTDRVVYLRIPSPVRTDTLTVHDSIDVPIPIEQRRYEDSLYTAWVSGYEPALDSIRLHQPTIVVERTLTRSAPRLSVGIQTGAGVGVWSRQPDIYVGIGASWRLWP